ncbi:MAG: flagellar hook capping FlgD N-terminal domain-containing protein [Lachnospiraceae bacterium]
MAEIGEISGSGNPYDKQYYSAGANDRNTLDISDYFSLLASQLANQDMTNPMDNGEMMAQMVQMAMMQSITAMTDSMNNNSVIATQTYAAGLVGQEVTIVQTEENSYGQEEPVGVKYGKVSSVNLANIPPTIKIEGDDKEYPLSYIMGMGQLEDPYKPDPDEKPEGGGDTDGTGKPEEPEKPKDPAAKGLFAF